MENWVNLKYEGFGHYSISDKGNIKGPRGDIKSRVNSRGYCIVGLRNGSSKQKMFSVHRLVAEHFIDNPENKSQVNHKDFKKDNNDISNLEWVTDMENKIHYFESKKFKYIWGNSNYNSSKKNHLTKQEYVEKRNEILRNQAVLKRKKIKVVNEKMQINKVFDSIKEAASYLPCNEKTIRNCLKNRHISRLGYTAEYI